MGTLVATAPPGSIQGIGPTGPTSPYGLPTGGVPYYGSPPGKEKEKGPSMGEVVSDNLSVAKAKVAGGSHKAVDIAIVKATTAKFSVVPKEKHVRTLKMAVHGGQPGSYAGYVISKLLDRLRGAKHWLCALKTLMVFHRLMRESEGASFVAELLRFGDMSRGGYRGHALNMDNFVDSGSAEGRFDYSEWVRVYARYLDEQLEVYAKTAFYQEAEGTAPTESKMRNLPPAELLTQLPPLQRLLERLMDCLPRGAASRHYVVQAALLTVAKESFQIYRAISEGIINLADCFFDMEYSDAQKGLEIYKQHTLDNDKLGAYYAQAEQIEELKRSATFPKLTPPSPDFLGMMEEYVQSAPRDEASKKTSPLRKGRNLKDEEKSGELPPPIDSGLSGVIHPEEALQEEAPPPTPPAPEPEMDLLNFDEPEEPAASPPPPREKTATELLEEEQAAAAAMPSMQNGAAGQQGGFTPQQPPSNNPFGEGASFGGQQQQQQGGFGPGAVVPYGQNTFGAGGPGWGPQPGYGQQYGYGQQPYGGQYGYGQQQYGSYPGGAPVQPGAMIPYGLNGLGSPGYGIHGSPGFGSQAGAPSPQGSFNRSPTPYATTPGGNPTQSFKDAALNDPFADLGAVRPTQPQPQSTPPLREVSPTQQRINLGTRSGSAQSFPQQGGYGAPQQQWQQQQQQQPSGAPHQGQQQPQQNGWANGGGFASFPASSASPAGPAPQQGWGQ